jgi:cell division protein ZipA
LASELRFVLAAICVPLLLAIWWWSARRSSQAPGNPELRESAVATEREGMHEPPEATASFGSARDWSVSPLEPLSIRTADFEPTPPDDPPMSATPSRVDPLNIPVLHVAEAVEQREEREPTLETAVLVPNEPERAREPPEAATAPTGVAPATPIAPAPPAAPVVPVAPAMAAARAARQGPLASLDTAGTGENRQAPNASDMQRIVGVRVCAAGALPWDGAALMVALENHGMAFGRYQVFHRRHSDGRSLFCAASLVEPGTFNPANMPRQQFQGLTLFAVLPGPVEAVQTFDGMIRAAVGLAKDLRGTVQDSTGVLLTPLRLEELREDVARFQAMLTID